MKKIIIAIDGPAASGKGTLARNLAEKLNLAHMDTGALYRAVAFEISKTGLSVRDKKDAIAAAKALRKKIESAQRPADILGRPVLREDRFGRDASVIAVIPEIREILADLQKDFARAPGEGFAGAVLDGRDIGTVICPEADIKLYIVADTEIRAQRRMKELQSKGISVTYDAVLDDMRKRDARDEGRKTAPLTPAADAVLLDTTHLLESEALERALEIVRERLP